MGRFLIFLSMVLAGAGSVAAERTHRIGVVVFDGFLTSEVTAPVEVFTKANVKSDASFEVLIVAPSRTAVTSEEGIRITPDVDFAGAPELDVLVVPSSLDVDGLMANERLVRFIAERGRRVRWLHSNCAGAFLLGKAGLLDGRRVTTYIGGHQDLKKRFPEAEVVDERVVADGNLVSSVGGVTSYDAALTLLAEMMDAEVADSVAEALYYFHWGESPRSATSP